MAGRVGPLTISVAVDKTELERFCQEAGRLADLAIARLDREGADEAELLLEECLELVNSPEGVTRRQVGEFKFEYRLIPVLWDLLEELRQLCE